MCQGKHQHKLHKSPFLVCLVFPQLNNRHKGDMDYMIKMKAEG